MSEITKSKTQNPKPKIQISWLLFAFVIVFIYFFALSIPLLGPDEPRYSQIAREMFERGDWITPKLGGFDWFEKPALLYWLQITFFNLFGVSEFAARFGSALFGLGTIASLWILGRSLATENTENHREFEDKNAFSSSSVNSVAKNDFANYLALISASSIGLIAFSRGASFDIILTFPITASLVSFFIFDSTQRRKDAKTQKFYLLPFTFYLLSFYFFIGISLIAKGLVGIVFPFAIVAFYHVLSWRLPSKTFIFSLIWGTILAIIVASAWYLPMYNVNGWKFIDEFIIQHHFQRYTSNKYQHPQPFWFFFAILPLMTIPWLPFFLASIWNLFKVQSSKKNHPFTLSPFHLFSFAWLLVPLVFFSLSGSKLPGYILPALPAALILTAFEVYKFVQKGAKHDLFVKVIAFATFVVVAVILQFFIMDYARHETTKYLIETANAQGFKTQKVVNLYAVQHNLEFYAAGRVVRDTEGKIKRYDDFAVLINEMKRENTDEMLVVVANHAVKHLTENSLVNAKIIDDNGEVSLVYIKLR